MSNSKVDIKGFYKQRKKRGAASTKSSKSKKTSRALTSVLDLQDEFSESERMLRTFDMNMAYGPCSGMTRIERWERALRLGLKPPMEIKAAIMSTDINQHQQCLWYPRV